MTRSALGLRRVLDISRELLGDEFAAGLKLRPTGPCDPVRVRLESLVSQLSEPRPLNHAQGRLRGTRPGIFNLENLLGPVSFSWACKMLWHGLFY